jgi:hypothetical protein
MSFDPVTYFEKVASNLKDIGHSDTTPRFFRTRTVASLDELLDQISSAQFPALMVHDTIDGALGDFYQSDSYMEEPQYVFYVLQQAEFGNQQSIGDAIEQCRAIGRKILAQMIQHRYRGQHGLDFMDTGRIPFQTVGPLHDNVYGMMYMFYLSQEAAMQHDSEDWEESW